MKSYTDIEQSKKLSELLSFESADMSYYIWKDDGHLVSLVPFVLDGTEVKEGGMFEYIPCWSLAALLDIIPKYINMDNTLRIDVNENSFAIWYDEIGCGVNNDLPDITADNPIDACYQMIIRLNELNLL